MELPIIISKDLEILGIFALVLILPKALLRFKIPSGITALILGMIATTIDPQISNDQLFKFLSQIGITSLFLFAGLEVNFKELRDDRNYISKYLTISLIALFAMAWAFSHGFSLSYQEALIFSLGIFTPSAGFIINSLHSFNLNVEQEYWIKSKAISKEVVAILLLFVAMQGDSVSNLATSIGLFAVLMISLPFIFRFLFRFISPYAPNSEVPLLIVLSLFAGVVSKEIGAYYLVGAFAVGLVGSSFKNEIFKENEEMMFNSVSHFFTLFLPFYFFGAGMKIKFADFSFQALAMALALVAVFVPFRIGVIRYSIRTFLKTIGKTTADISLSLMPTLIFGLVIFGVLVERGNMPQELTYSLLIYTLITSVIPSVVMALRKDRA